MPAWNWDTVNFWSQIAFAFTGLELVSAMSEEVRDPRRTLPRAVFGAGALIALMYIGGTFAILALMPAASIDPQSGVFSAITVGSVVLKIGLLGVLAAMLVTVGNAGGVGSTVAGIARVPFVVGIDRYLPAAFGKIHPKWKTPYISILVQAVLSGTILVLSQIRQKSVVLTTCCQCRDHSLFHSISLHVCRCNPACDQEGSKGKRSCRPGTWWRCGRVDLRHSWISGCPGGHCGFVPPGGSTQLEFEQLVGGTSVSILIGLFLYWRGARSKRGGLARCGRWYHPRCYSLRVCVSEEWPKARNFRM